MKLLLAAVLLAHSLPNPAPSQVVTASLARSLVECREKPDTPTVVLIPGGGAKPETWDKVLDPISAFTRVCTYERSGPAENTNPPSVTEIITNLKDQLTAANAPPPYILVGHSIGGLYARAFDKHYDNLVAAMLLLDSSHEEQIWRFQQSEPAALAEYPRWQDQSFMATQGFLPPNQHLEWQFHKPLIVIEHGIPPEPVWHAMQKDLGSRAPHSQLITASHSHHYIQNDEPQLVIDAVHALTNKTRRLPTK
ncbi:MAG: alpha/beta hydrolase [Rhodospirillales bacterium]|nr:alpha/beta hydrolase [Acetobacter sp.]